MTTLESAIRTAVLRGRDHTALGAIASVSEGSTAVSLSRGGAPKRYRYQDENEDAAGFARGPGGSLVAVADGHGGFLAAETAVEWLLDTSARGWVSADAGDLRARWEETARDALFGAHTEILARATREGVEGTRTTLAFALVRPRDGWLAFASVGDSHVFHVAAGEVVDLAAPEERGLFFLGTASETRETLLLRVVSGSEPLADTRALVLVTDGLSERHIGVDLPEATVGEVVAAALPAARDLRPLGTARGVVEAALAAHARHDAGDNVASAVAFLSAS